MRHSVFVNYRVGDRHNEAALIADGLTRRFGPDQVFFASRSLPLGGDFETGLLVAVRESAVMLAVIGPRWLDISDGGGRRRLDDPDDWVRREIAEALRLGIPVVPVLIGDRAWLDSPRADQLPADLAALARCQYIRLHYRDLRLDELIDGLIRISPGLATARLLSSATVPPPAQLPPAVPDFVNRRAELQRLRRACARAGPATRLLAVTSRPGVGKSTLAIRFAHEAAELCPDAQLYTDLRGADAVPVNPAYVLGASSGRWAWPRTASRQRSPSSRRCTGRCLPSVVRSWCSTTPPTSGRSTC